MDFTLYYMVPYPLGVRSKSFLLLPHVLVKDHIFKNVRTDFWMSHLLQL